MRAGGSSASAGNGMAEPVAIIIGRRYGPVRPFRSSGATETRWAALATQGRGAAPYVGGPEGRGLA